MRSCLRGLLHGRSRTHGAVAPRRLLVNATHINKCTFASLSKLADPPRLHTIDVGRRQNKVWEYMCTVEVNDRLGRTCKRGGYSVSLIVCGGRTIWGGRFFRFGGIQVAAVVALTRDASSACLFTAFASDLDVLV